MSSLLHSRACSDALMLVLGMVHSAAAVLVLDHGTFDVSMSLHGLACLELVMLVSWRFFLVTTEFLKSMVVSLT